MDEPSLIVGVDVGGSKFHVGVVDAQGTVRAARRRPTLPEQGPEAWVDALVAEIRASLEELDGRAGAVGIGIAGQVDDRAGVLRSSPNLPGWIDAPVARLVADRLQVPVVLGNDMNFIAFGEWRFGAGRAVDDLVVLFVGTGVGAGVITGGRPLVGARGFAGELGHVPVVAGGRRCHCPGYGCLEAYVSGWALAERAHEAIARDSARAAAFLSAARTVEGAITAESVAVALVAGDPVATELIAESGRYLGAALVGYANAFNPARIVVGGGVLDGIPGLVEMAARYVESEAIRVVRERLEIVPSRLGSTAGVLGAAAYAREHAQAR